MMMMMMIRCCSSCGRRCRYQYGIIRLENRCTSSIMVLLFVFILSIIVVLTESLQPVKAVHSNFPKLSSSSSSTTTTSLSSILDRTVLQRLKQKQTRQQQHQSFLSSSSSSSLSSLSSGYNDLLDQGNDPTIQQLSTTTTNTLLKDDGSLTSTSYRGGGSSSSPSFLVETVELTPVQHNDVHDDTSDAAADACVTTTTPPPATTITMVSTRETHPTIISSTIVPMNRRRRQEQQQLQLIRLRFQKIIQLVTTSAFSRDTKNLSIFVTSMSFLAGFTDVLYYSRYNCYVNMMTGNTMKMIIKGCEHQYKDSMFYLSLCTVYIVGTVLVAQLQQKQKLNTEIQQSTAITSTQINGSKVVRTKAIFPISLTIAPMVWILFVLSDIVSFMGMQCTNSILCQSGAILISFCYGMMNPVVASMTNGAVLYALTGHFHKFGSGLHETYQQMKHYYYYQQQLIKIDDEQTDSEKENDRVHVKLFNTEKKTVTNNDDDDDYAVKVLSTTLRTLFYHTKIIFGFMMGVAVAAQCFSILPNLLQIQTTSTITGISTTPKRLLQRLLLRNVVPFNYSYLPINTMIGTIYATLLVWYGRNAKQS